MARPYLLWTKEAICEKLVKQAIYFGYSEEEIEFIKEAVFDERWDPRSDFNGCTLVQDVYHPYLPCFLHDYFWVVYGPSKKSNIKFYWDLRRCGMPQAKARRWYIAVSIGMPFYKLKNKIKNA